LLSTGRLKIAAALLLTSPYVPMLFHGEEWGASTPFQYFTSHEDPVLADQVRQGRSREFAAFGWSPEHVPDPQDEATFARSRLRWEEMASPRHSDLLDWHRQLIRLRRHSPVLLDGNYQACDVSFDEAGKWLVIRRGHLAVACNCSPERRHVPVDRTAEIVLSSEPGVEASADSCTLPPESVAILRVIP
jgi:maltooligosyltrehalose trehalohydrolase